MLHKGEVMLPFCELCFGQVIKLSQVTSEEHLHTKVDFTLDSLLNTGMDSRTHSLWEVNTLKISVIGTDFI